ncbi:MAG: efflux RND transporter periplasmic adaptor subunit [Bryobacterales bacterium]|nr:efflux RND transporter periplasmic adaptor subunit [Bryobacterales bacterium]
MSTAPLPGPAPAPRRAPGRPQIVPTAPRPKRRGPWLFIAGVAGLGLALWMAWQTLAPRFSDGGGGAGPAVSTIPVRSGKVDRTIRLTGTVKAENFAAIMAPSMRGSRSGRSYQSRSRSGSSQRIQVSSSSMYSSGGGGSASGGGGFNIASTNQATMAGRGATSLGAQRGSTNRFADRTTAAAPAASSSGSQSGSGGDALGSTSGSLFSPSGGGGGGGRRGDFMTFLLECAEPGAFVKKGDVIAEFDRESMLRRVDDYRSAVDQAESDIRKLDADLAVAREALRQSLLVAKADLEKSKLDLQTIEVVSDMDAQRLKLAAEEADARYQQLLKDEKLLERSQASELRAAKIESDQTTLELQRAENNANRLLVNAPISGMVVMTSIRRGSEMVQASAGDQLYPGQMFMQIVDPSSMVVNAFANQVDVEALRLGMKATVRLDAFPDAEYEARVEAIGAMASSGRRPDFMKQLPVRLRIFNADSRVLPDLSASADVVIDETQEELPVVPLLSLHEDESGKTFVYVPSGKDWRRQEVEVVVRNSVEAAVRGIEAGQQVAEGDPFAAPAERETASVGPPGAPGSN